MQDSSGQLRSYFPANLAYCRKARGMTQEYLANLCGLQRTYLCGLEKGRGNPTLSTLMNLASVLRMDPGGLLVSAEWQKKFYLATVDKKNQDCYYGCRTRAFFL